MSAQQSGGIYTKILGSLLILTFITVYISRHDWGRPMNISIGVLVAVIKASLVVLFFMHMKYEQRWWASLVLFPLALVMIIIFANFPDTAVNSDHTNPAVPQIPHAGKAGPAH